MICKICGKEMEKTYKIKYNMPTIYRKNTERQDRYVQNLQVCDDCQFVCCTNPVDEEFLDYLYMEGDDYTNYNSCLAEKENYIMRCNIAKSIFKALNLKLKSVLDIGASTGFFLNILKKDIDEVCGVETSKSGVETAHNRYKIDLFRGGLHEFSEITTRNYDMVTCMHVMEHIDDLSAFMEELCYVAKSMFMLKFLLYLTFSEESHLAFLRKNI